MRRTLRVPRSIRLLPAIGIMSLVISTSPASSCVVCETTDIRPLLLDWTFSDPPLDRVFLRSEQKFKSTLQAFVYGPFQAENIGFHFNGISSVTHAPTMIFWTRDKVDEGAFTKDLEKLRGVVSRSNKPLTLSALYFAEGYVDDGDGPFLPSLAEMAHSYIGMGTSTDEWTLGGGACSIARVRVRFTVRGSVGASKPLSSERDKVACAMATVMTSYGFSNAEAIFGAGAAEVNGDFYPDVSAAAFLTYLYRPGEANPFKKGTSRADVVRHLESSAQ